VHVCIVELCLLYRSAAVYVKGQIQCVKPSDSCELLSEAK
jgi:hypothetical protein